MTIFDIDPDYTPGHAPGLSQIQEAELARFDLGIPAGDEVRLIPTALSFRAWRITVDNIEPLAAAHGLHFMHNGGERWIRLTDPHREAYVGDFLAETPKGLYVVAAGFDLGYLVEEESA